MGIPDPDVLQAGTKQQRIPVDSGQQQTLCVIPRIEKADGGDFKEEEEDGGVHGGEVTKGEDEFGGSSSGGRNSRSSLEETFSRGEQGKPRDHIQHQRSNRGPGGSAPELRPLSGESVASAGTQYL
ncbi:hypothetical protein NDU88_002682 [Pleurodeles waltl]|uniref:Uncharacterized protein n=1 Tax=Pleurodeles waltl TaxID=8319 RepID=A0AAV7W2U7_PLEWA|nr:hypothetical protein NDU88_002682 [Pleurodeles waltl]